MASKGEWSKQVTHELRSRMLASANECYQNGCDLVADAELLHHASRWPRSAALAILAEEEFSKAFILRVCANQGRWDSNVHEALRKHSNKQGISQAMREYLDLVIPNALRVEDLNKHALIPSQPDMFLSPQHLDPIFQRARQTFTKPQRDYLKQDALYVSIAHDGSTVSAPKAVDQAKASECMLEARKLKAVLDFMGGDTAAIEIWR